MNAVRQIRKYAEEHYNEGGNIIVECWSTKDIRSLIKDALENNTLPLDAAKAVMMGEKEAWAEALAILHQMGH